MGSFTGIITIACILSKSYYIPSYLPQITSSGSVLTGIQTTEYTSAHSCIPDRPSASDTPEHRCERTCSILKLICQQKFWCLLQYPLFSASCMGRNTVTNSTSQTRNVQNNILFPPPNNLISSSQSSSGLWPTSPPSYHQSSSLRLPRA